MSDRARRVLWASILLTFVVYLVPFGQWLIYPVWLLSTLFHELGHGVAAVTVGGTFETFTMWPNGSGVATWTGDVGRVGRAWVSAGGLIGPAVIAAVCFVFARRTGLTRALFALFAVALLAAEVLVVRNTFGLVFVGATVMVFAWLGLRASANTSRLALVFLAVQLALSVFSRGDYLFTETAHTSQGVMPSDVAHIATSLAGPYWLWGALCGAFSVLALMVGMRAYLGGRSNGPSQPAV